MIFFKIYYHRISYYKTYNYVFLIISSISQYQNSYMIFLSAIYPLIIYFIKCDRSHRWNSLFSFDLYLQNTIYPIWPLAINLGDGPTVRRSVVMFPVSNYENKYLHQSDLLHTYLRNITILFIEKLIKSIVSYSWSINVYIEDWTMQIIPDGPI